MEPIPASGTSVCGLPLTGCRTLDTSPCRLVLKYCLRYVERLKLAFTQGLLSNTSAAANMKIVQSLLLLLPLAAALPSSPHTPLGDYQITDPDRIAQLEIQHAHVLDGLRSGKIIPATAEDLRTTEFGTHEKRIFTVFGLAGVALIEAIGAGVNILGTLGERLYVIFSASSNVIWHNPEYCRTYFQTHAGGEENIQIFARGSTGITQETHLK